MFTDIYLGGFEFVLPPECLQLYCFMDSRILIGTMNSRTILLFHYSQLLENGVLPSIAIRAVDGITILL